MLDQHESLCFHSMQHQSVNTDLYYHVGFGTIVGSSIAGKIMTRDFVRFEQRYLEAHPDAPPPSKSRKAFASDFPMYVLTSHGLTIQVH